MTMRTTPRTKNNLRKRKKVSAQIQWSVNSQFLFKIVAEEPKKKLTKKELKALEDAEFEAALAGVTPTTAPAEEKKQEEAPKPGQGNSKNQAKKAKAKAKKEAEEKAKAEAAKN